MIKKIYVAVLILPVLAISFLTRAGLVSAETIEITVSGNGSGSESQATVTSTTNTTVNQSNDAQINNNVSTNANTGNNTVSQNSGDTTIQTGDVNTTTNVENNNINSNSATNCGCGGTDTFVNVTDNGSHSTNNVNISVGSNVNVNQENVANVTNKVETNANTGDNKANYNLGKVGIFTGDIISQVNISNKNINSNKAVFGSFFDPIFNISGNGAFSNNTITYNFTNNSNYTNKNEFNLTNLVFSDLNTGGNEASKNNGDVTIDTGDILSFVNIDNSGNNNVIINKPSKEGPCTQNCGGNNIPPSTTNPGSGSGGGSSSGGESGPAAIGSVLPATGSIWLYVMTLLCMILLLTGWYLRFTTGVSPPARA